MKRVNIFSAFLFAAILGSLGSCQTEPESISSDLAPNEYFQEGQEAFGKSHNETALLYYRTFVERYPDMTQKVVEAEYEIAFIIYKSGELEKAGNLFSAILDKYNAPGTGCWCSRTGAASGAASRLAPGSLGKTLGNH